MRGTIKQYSMNPLPIIAVVALLATQIPSFGNVVFKLIPATVSVVTGFETKFHRLFTETSTEELLPIPRTAIESGEPNALCLKMMKPSSVPAVVGANLT